MMKRSLRMVVAALVLWLIPEVFAQAAEGFKTRLDAIVKTQEEVKQRLSKGLEGKATEEARQPLFDQYQTETARNVGKVADLVRENPNDPNVVKALRFVIETAGRGPGDESYRAMELLLHRHVRDAGMGDLCGRIFHFVHAPVAESLLRAVLKTHPDHRDRGMACHTLAIYLGMRAQMVRQVRQGLAKIDRYVHGPFKETTERLVRAADLEALDREVEALLERVVTEFPDVRDWFTPERTIGAIAQGELFAIRNLSVGRVAPEIRGEDHEGRSFALSDFRNGVVVLTFSASWCGPCVAMYPEERKLVKELAGKPFALVSVNADANVGTLKKSIATGEITWRCWWDGGMDGPITTQWGISSIPAIFILDQMGVIRFKGLRGDKLEKAVGALLKEGPVEKPCLK